MNGIICGIWKIKINAIRKSLACSSLDFAVSEHQKYDFPGPAITQYPRGPSTEAMQYAVPATLNKISCVVQLEENLINSIT